jgi:hypothetical protein
VRGEGRTARAQGSRGRRIRGRTRAKYSCGPRCGPSAVDAPLVPENPDDPDITLDPKDDADLRVVAELLDVLGP